MKKFTYLFFVTGLLFLIIACKKDKGPAQPAGSGRPAEVAVKLYSKDCPTGSSLGTISSIRVDLQRVMIFSESKGWIDLRVKKGVYDLVALQNDVGTYIADRTELNVTDLKYLYIYFGRDNSVVANKEKRCLLLSDTEAVVTIDTRIRYGVLTEIGLNFDFCNALTAAASSAQDACYILKTNIATRGYSDVSI